MTRKPTGPNQPRKPETKPKVSKCPRCSSTEKARDGADLVCGNCNAMLIKDYYRR